MKRVLDFIIIKGKAFLNNNWTSLVKPNKSHSQYAIRLFGKKILLAILLALGIYGASAQERQKIAINSNWLFYKGTPTQSNTIEKQLVNIPHTWNIEDSRDDEPGYYRGKGQYEKTVRIPASWNDKKVYLFFEGANQTTTLFVNGNKVGNHKGGYTAFRFKISDFIKYGEDNAIRVEVDNSHDNDILPLEADFTFFGGIYRDVFLEAVQPVHFDMDNYGSDGIFIDTPNVNDQEGTIAVRGSLTNESNSKSRLKVVSTLYSPDYKEVASSQTKVSVGAGERKPFRLPRIRVPSPSLWSPDTPELYTIKHQLIELATDVVVDQRIQTMGFRWYSFNEQKQFMLNGKPLFLKGVNRHQDYSGLGNALPDQLHIKDLRMIKEMGANFIRLAHYPQDPSVLKACDNLGLIVWEEIPIINQITTTQAFKQNSVTMLKEMIRQHYNHPSLIMVGYMNEVLIGLRKNDKTQEELKTYIPKVKELSDVLHKTLKEESQERISVIAFENKPERYREAQMLKTNDVIGWNIYDGWYGGNFSGFGNRIDRILEEYQEVPIIVSEYGAGSDPRIHTYTPKRFDFSEEYAQLYHRRILGQIEGLPNVAGVAIWIFADFSSERRKDAVPNINNKGVVALDRTPKDVYYLYKSRWNKAPMVHIAVADWKIQAGREKGKKGVSDREIRVYSNLKEVELFHNGESIGKKNIENFMATWSVPFSDGKNRLKAWGMDKNDGQVEDNAVIDFDLIPKDLSGLKPEETIHVNLGTHFTFFDEVTQSVYIPSTQYNGEGFGHLGGRPFMMNDWRTGTNRNILSTKNDPLYQTQLVGLEGYRFDVPNGEYEITLHFANLNENGNKKRLVNDLSTEQASSSLQKNSVFDVTINGVTFLEQLDVTASRQALAYKTQIYVSESKGILIGFRNILGEPVLNAIDLKKIK